MLFYCISNTALRKTMLRAHRQAWAWQDEWFGLTMSDIREIERQTQEALRKKMAQVGEGEENEGDEDDEDGRSEMGKDSGGDNQSYVSSKSSEDLKTSSRADCWTASQRHAKSDSENISAKDNESCSSSSSSGDEPTQFSNPTPSVKVKISDLSDSSSRDINRDSLEVKKQQQQHASHSKEHIAPNAALNRGSGCTSNLNSPGSKSNKSFELMETWKMEGLMKKDSEDEEGSDDEFFDCLGKYEYSTPRTSR
jgi:hypothetical protein